MEVRDLACLAARAADDKGGSDIVVVSVGDVLAITEIFVIATGGNARQVKAIAEAIEYEVAQADDLKPLRLEGLDSREWVLMDYGAFVVHIFDEESREFYELQRLYADQPTIEWLSAEDRAARQPG